MWNFYAGSHDGTRRRLNDGTGSEAEISGELYTLDLNVSEVALVEGGSEIRSRSISIRLRPM